MCNCLSTRPRMVKQIRVHVVAETQRERALAREYRKIGATWEAKIAKLEVISKLSHSQHD